MFAPDGADAPSQFSDVYLLGDCEGIADLDTKVTHGAFYFRMAKQKLYRPEIPRLAVNQRRLRAAQGMRPKQARVQTDHGNPSQTSLAY